MYPESRRYNEHMQVCKGILNKMKLLLSFSDLPNDVNSAIHRRQSFKELNRITENLLSLKNKTSSRQSLEEETIKENDTEARTTIKKSKFCLPNTKFNGKVTEENKVINKYRIKKKDERNVFKELTANKADIVETAISSSLKLEQIDEAEITGKDSETRTTTERCKFRIHNTNTEAELLELKLHSVTKFKVTEDIEIKNNNIEIEFTQSEENMPKNDSEAESKQIKKEQISQTKKQSIIYKCSKSILANTDIEVRTVFIRKNDTEKMLKKVESVEEVANEEDSDSDWDEDSLPYNASFMSLTLTANELEVIDKKVNKLCDNKSQSDEEKYKILQSVFFKEKVKNLNIENTNSCLSPICWTKNLNCNKNNSVSLNSNAAQFCSYRKKYTFGPTTVTAMPVLFRRNNSSDNSEDDDKLIYRKLKKLKYRLRRTKERKCMTTGAKCETLPHEPSINSLPLETDDDNEYNNNNSVTKYQQNTARLCANKLQPNNELTVFYANTDKQSMSDSNSSCENIYNDMCGARNGRDLRSSDGPSSSRCRYSDDYDDFDLDFRYCTCKDQNRYEQSCNSSKYTQQKQTTTCESRKCVKFNDYNSTQYKSCENKIKCPKPNTHVILENDIFSKQKQHVTLENAQIPGHTPCEEGNVSNKFDKYVPCTPYNEDREPCRSNQYKLGENKSLPYKSYKYIPCDNAKQRCNFNQFTSCDERPPYRLCDSLPENDRISWKNNKYIPCTLERLPCNTVTNLPCGNERLPCIANTYTPCENERLPCTSKYIPSENDKLPCNTRKYPLYGNKKIPCNAGIYIPSENKKLLYNTSKYLPCETERLTCNASNKYTPCENESLICNSSKYISYGNERLPCNTNEYVPCENDKLSSNSSKYIPCESVRFPSNTSYIPRQTERLPYSSCQYTPYYINDRAPCKSTTYTPCDNKRQPCKFGKYVICEKKTSKSSLCENKRIPCSTWKKNTDECERIPYKSNKYITYDGKYLKGKTSSKVIYLNIFKNSQEDCSFREEAVTKKTSKSKSDITIKIIPSDTNKKYKKEKLKYDSDSSSEKIFKVSPGNNTSQLIIKINSKELNNTEKKKNSEQKPSSKKYANKLSGSKSNIILKKSRDNFSNTSRKKKYKCESTSLKSGSKSSITLICSEENISDTSKKVRKSDSTVFNNSKTNARVFNKYIICENEKYSSDTKYIICKNEQSTCEPAKKIVCKRKKKSHDSILKKKIDNESIYDSKTIICRNNTCTDDERIYDSKTIFCTNNTCTDDESIYDYKTIFCTNNTCTDDESMYDSKTIFCTNNTCTEDESMYDSKTIICGNKKRRRNSCLKKVICTDEDCTTRNASKNIICKNEARIRVPLLKKIICRDEKSKKFVCKNEKKLHDSLKKKTICQNEQVHNSYSACNVTSSNDLPSQISCTNKTNTSDTSAKIMCTDNTYGSSRKIICKEKEKISKNIACHNENSKGDPSKHITCKNSDGNLTKFICETKRSTSEPFKTIICENEKSVDVSSEICKNEKSKDPNKYVTCENKKGTSNPSKVTRCKNDNRANVFTQNDNCKIAKSKCNSSTKIMCENNKDESTKFIVCENETSLNEPSNYIVCKNKSNNYEPSNYIVCDNKINNNEPANHIVCKNKNNNDEPSDYIVCGNNNIKDEPLKLNMCKNCSDAENTNNIEELSKFNICENPRELSTFILSRNKKYNTDSSTSLFRKINETSPKNVTYKINDNDESSKLRIIENIKSNDSCLSQCKHSTNKCKIREFEKNMNDPGTCTAYKNNKGKYDPCISGTETKGITFENKSNASKLSIRENKVICETSKYIVRDNGDDILICEKNIKKKLDPTTFHVLDETRTKSNQNVYGGNQNNLCDPITNITKAGASYYNPMQYVPNNPGITNYDPARYSNMYVPQYQNNFPVYNPQPPIYVIYDNQLNLSDPRPNSYEILEDDVPNYNNTYTENNETPISNDGKCPNKPVITYNNVYPTCKKACSTSNIVHSEGNLVTPTCNIIPPKCSSNTSTCNNVKPICNQLASYHSSGFGQISDFKATSNDGFEQEEIITCDEDCMDDIVSYQASDEDSYILYESFEFEDQRKRADQRDEDEEDGCAKCCKYCCWRCCGDPDEDNNILLERIVREVIKERHVKNIAINTRVFKSCDARKCPQKDPSLCNVEEFKCMGWVDPYINLRNEASKCRSCCQSASQYCTASAPCQTAPAPCQTAPAPCQTAPAPCQTAPAPCHTVPVPCPTASVLSYIPVSCTAPAPCQTAPAPCQTAPAPCHTVPVPCPTASVLSYIPVSCTAPAPCQTAPAPCQTAPAPCHTVPVPCRTASVLSYIPVSCPAAPAPCPAVPAPCPSVQDCTLTTTCESPQLLPIYVPPKKKEKQNITVITIPPAAPAMQYPNPQYTCNQRWPQSLNNCAILHQPPCYPLNQNMCMNNVPGQNFSSNCTFTQTMPRRENCPVGQILPPNQQMPYICPRNMPHCPNRQQGPFR